MNDYLNIKIVSVDPRQIPEGLRHPEVTERFWLRHNVADSIAKKNSPCAAEILFGVKSSGSKSGLVSALRAISGLTLVIFCILVMSSVFKIEFGLATCIVAAVYGLSLIFGIGTRILSIAAGTASVMALMSSPAPTILIAASCLFVISLAFALVGPGKYSFDNRFQKGLNHVLKENARWTGNLDDYKAFSRL